MTRKTIRTMEELATEIDVSRPTLSRYFHDPSSVRSKTRAKIEARLTAVDYVPNFFARNLNRKRTRLIGVVVPHLNDIFQTSLINAIDAAAGESDYKIIVQNSDNDPAREAAAIEALRSMNADGILIAPLGLASDTEMLRRAETHLPLVLIDSRADTEIEAFDFVGNDNHHSIGLVVDYLVRSGHDPVFLPMPPVNLNAVERVEAYRAAMARHDRPAEVLADSAEAPHWDFERHGHSVMHAEFAAGRHTRATVLCASDRVAMGALKAAHEFGLFPQGKASGFHLAGHDNDALTRFLHPGLTTVEQDVPRIAREAVSILLGRIETPRSPDGPHDFRRIPGRLVLRESA
ncbi:LacI family DNA-binding transcriptional regulator [Paracoccus xiamenensis]|uniref:LacI family DNA-binding transcriptional regulator n=1 Tax=Paracoccus xiamenensis TaxID=2714901 RepID=UPI00140D9D4E|nr:LacI family DNA-binding transcriptional regulator [Paracoccus xiamenensis]NHF72332.1 LacI family transcriptional regulator [Paracoccus xiamenensis]